MKIIIFVLLLLLVVSCGGEKNDGPHAHKLSFTITTSEGESFYQEGCRYFVNGNSTQIEIQCSCCSAPDFAYTDGKPLKIVVNKKQ